MERFLSAVEDVAGHVLVISTNGLLVSKLPMLGLRTQNIRETHIESPKRSDERGTDPGTEAVYQGL